MKNKFMDEEKFKRAIKSIYHSVNKLKEAFQGRKFTPDGKLVGDIGEAIGAILYDLELDPKGRKHWDGWWYDRAGSRREVQIRATQCDTTYLKKPAGEGTLLIFEINREKDGEYGVVYNGDIRLAWSKVEHQKSKEKTISLNNLRELQKSVDPDDMIPMRK